ncbi:MAG: hypothetical protein KAG70_00355, partial [Alcanivorax sp.]|nr:hypothetical protein [Alcanivorax sp.]
EGRAASMGLPAQAASWTSRNGQFDRPATKIRALSELLMGWDGAKNEKAQTKKSPRSEDQGLVWVREGAPNKRVS